MDACERFLDQLTASYLIAKGERKNELDGRRVPRFDAAGLHPFSATYGAALAWFVATDLDAELLPSAREVERAGFEDATAEWLRQHAAKSEKSGAPNGFRLLDD